MRWLMTALAFSIVQTATLDHSVSRADLSVLLAYLVARRHRHHAVAVIVGLNSELELRAKLR